MQEEYMTQKEFNEKYKDYLEEGHYGLAINDQQIIDYLNIVFQDLIRIPGFKYYQIKTKFNTCRFYTNLHGILPEIGNIIEFNIENRLNDFLLGRAVFISKTN